MNLGTLLISAITCEDGEMISAFWSFYTTMSRLVVQLGNSLRSVCNISALKNIESTRIPKENIAEYNLPYNKSWNDVAHFFHDA